MSSHPLFPVLSCKDGGHSIGHVPAMSRDNDEASLIEVCVSVGIAPYWHNNRVHSISIINSFDVFF